MQNRFTTELLKSLSSIQDRQKSALITKEEYELLISDIIEAKQANSKTNHQYYLLRKFDVLVCGDVQKVIKKQNRPDDIPIYYVALENVYDVVKRAHNATGHGGRDKMGKEIRKKYANITDDVLTLFKSFCIECQRKKKRTTTKGIVVRPILTQDYCSRGQVDLIDMQSMPQGEYRFIMVYQDHLTKYCMLRPLPNKRAACVAFHLMDVFLNFGAPAILQSDNGTEFTAQVVNELKGFWPDLVIVHGKPRHPQSQGSVERANGDIKDMLIAWLGDNSTNNWTLGLKFVQFQKNYSYHSGIKCSPFAALFGSDAKVGLTTANLPQEILHKMLTEDDLMAIFQTSSMTESILATDSTNLQLPLDSTSVPLDNDTTSTHQDMDSTIESSVLDNTNIQSLMDNTAMELEMTTINVQTLKDSTNVTRTTDSAISSRQNVISEKRKRVSEAQLSQAERMVKRSRIIMVAGECGDNVTVPVPLIDRGRSDPRNLLGVIRNRDENDMYTIAVRGGILKGKYSRNQFDLCLHKLITDDELNLNSEISLRQAVQFESKCGGQGFVKCNCTGSKRCQTNRCKCFKASVMCNSRCHSSLVCCNKK